MKMPLFFKHKAKLIDAEGNCLTVVETPKKNGNSWLKALIPVAILAVGGLIGYGQLKERVDTTKVKADRLETVVLDTTLKQAKIEEALLSIKELLKEMREEQRELRKDIQKRR